MSSPSARKLTRREVGGLPLVARILERLGLRELLAEHLPAARRSAASPVDALFLLAINLSVAKDPLYELAGWVDALDLRALGLAAQPAAACSDDRFGRALGRLRIAKILRAELLLRQPAAEEKLAGAGLIVINPPWRLPDSLQRFLPALAGVLGGERASSRLDWLAGEAV